MCGGCGELVAAAVVPALENIALALGLRQTVQPPAGVGAGPGVAAFAVNADDQPDGVYGEVVAERRWYLHSFKLSDTASICLKVNPIWSRFCRGGDGKAVRRADGVVYLAWISRVCFGFQINGLGRRYR